MLQPLPIEEMERLMCECLCDGYVVPVERRDEPVVEPRHGDLASIVGGLNDILRPRVDIDSILADLEAMVTPLREGGAVVLGMTYPDASAILRPARAAMPRVLAFNEGVRELGRRTGMLVVDFGERGVVDPRLWDADRLHANPEGHARIADAMGEALGLEWEADPWAPLDPLPGVPRAVAARAEAVWMVRHMAPWVLRRIRRRSSGDGIDPKRPELAPVELA